MVAIFDIIESFASWWTTKNIENIKINKKKKSDVPLKEDVKIVNKSSKEKDNLKNIVQQKPDKKNKNEQKKMLKKETKEVLPVVKEEQTKDEQKFKKEKKSDMKPIEDFISIQKDNDDGDESSLLWSGLIWKNASKWLIWSWIWQFRWGCGTKLRKRE